MTSPPLGIEDFDELPCEACCLTVASGIGPAEALAVLADGNLVPFDSFDDAFDWAMECYESGSQRTPMRATSIGGAEALPEENGIGFGDEDLRATQKALLLIHRLTGLWVTGPWLDDTGEWLVGGAA